MRRHVQVYAKDLECAALGGSSGERVTVPPPLGFVAECSSAAASPAPPGYTAAPRLSAYILPIAPSPAAAELSQLDHDRARVLDAMREGYASVLITLADPKEPGGPPTRMAAIEVARQQITDAPWCTAAQVAVGGIRIDRRPLDDGGRLSA